jgi:hypothetical protein
MSGTTNQPETPTEKSTETPTVNNSSWSIRNLINGIKWPSFLKTSTTEKKTTTGAAGEGEGEGEGAAVKPEKKEGGHKGGRKSSKAKKSKKVKKTKKSKSAKKTKK